MQINIKRIREIVFVYLDSPFVYGQIINSEFENQLFILIPQRRLGQFDYRRDTWNPNTCQVGKKLEEEW